MRPVRHTVARGGALHLLDQLRLRSLSVVVAVLAAALAAGPAPARADGDPASDVLLVQDVFYPYQPPVSAPVQRALNDTVARAKRAGFAVKVALIGSPQDLGAVPMLFGAPQRYAAFLEQEIAYNDYPRLIVVMPQGIGLSHVGPVAALRVASGSDGLARAAIQAIVSLAARAGKRLPAPTLPAARGGGSATPVGPIAAAAAAVLILVAAVALVRRARARRPLPERGFGRD